MMGADNPQVEIDIVPLVDVLLVLVIILLAVAPAAGAAYLKFAQARRLEKADKPPARAPLRIEIGTGGRFRLGDRPLEAGALEDAVRREIARTRSKNCLLDPEPAATSRAVDAAYDAAEAGGCTWIRRLRRARR